MIRCCTYIQSTQSMAIGLGSLTLFLLPLTSRRALPPRRPSPVDPAFLAWVFMLVCLPVRLPIMRTPFPHSESIDSPALPHGSRAAYSLALLLGIAICIGIPLATGLLSQQGRERYSLPFCDPHFQYQTTPPSGLWCVIMA